MLDKMPKLSVTCVAWFYTLLRMRNVSVVLYLFTCETTIIINSPSKYKFIYCLFRKILANAVYVWVSANVGVRAFVFHSNIWTALNQIAVSSRLKLLKSKKLSSSSSKKKKKMKNRRQFEKFWRKRKTKILSSLWFCYSVIYVYFT